MRFGSPQRIDLIPAYKLAAVGDALELAAGFPWFLFVPWDHGLVMIVWVLDQGGFLLGCARGHRHY
jgi:hypothetical protein